MIGFTFQYSYSIFWPFQFLFPNYVGTAFVSHPYLVDSPGIDVYPGPNTICHLFFIWFIGIPQCKVSANYEMSRETSMWMRRIMRAPVVPILLMQCLWWGVMKSDTHGPSVQVKTWLKPQLRTSSSSFRPMISAKMRYWIQMVTSFLPFCLPSYIDGVCCDANVQSLSAMWGKHDLITSMGSAQPSHSALVGYSGRQLQSEHWSAVNSTSPLCLRLLARPTEPDPVSRPVGCGLE